jgi:hypothetical protein
MENDQKLEEGQEVVFQEASFSQSKFLIWEVNVQIVEILTNDMYRIRPVSGHGTRYVHISQLFH